MSRSTLYSLVFVAAATRLVFAQPDPADPNPLTEKQYPYGSQPYQVDPVTSAIRGPQTGYNQCNSTTQNQQSLCQTAVVNSLGDFCLWAPPSPNSTIGDTEGQEVAWCTKSGYGSRLIPAGALKAVQVLLTDEYIQFAGLIDQTLVDIASGDYGGELDPHGADLRGNPIGGLLYSNAFPTFEGNNNSFVQVIDWSEFIGGDSFCITICNPFSSSANQSLYCENRYDLLGCAYNQPSSVQEGVFEICDSALKQPVGIYPSGGVTLTYTQPNTGPVTPPYTEPIPSSSNCRTYASTDLYPSLPTPTTNVSATATGATRTGSGSAGAPTSTSNGASALGMSPVVGILGTLFALAFLS